jgi:hypothetical protein
VTSIEALRRLRSSLIKFDDEMCGGLDSLASQVRRAVEWLEVDRMQYWPAQIRRSNERLLEARNALERCQLRYGSEDVPSCYQEKKAVELATARLRLCEEKLRVTKNWIRSIQQTLNEFEGEMAQARNCLEGDVPRAVAALERMIESLAKYVEASPDVPPTKGGSQTEGASPATPPEKSE